MIFLKIDIETTGSVFRCTIVLRCTRIVSGHYSLSDNEHLEWP